MTGHGTGRTRANAIAFIGCVVDRWTRRTLTQKDGSVAPEVPSNNYSTPRGAGSLSSKGEEGTGRVAKIDGAAYHHRRTIERCLEV